MHLIYNDKEIEEVMKFKRAITADKAYRAIEEILEFTLKEGRNKNDQWTEEQGKAVDFIHDTICAIMENCNIDMELLYE